MSNQNSIKFSGEPDKQHQPVWATQIPDWPEAGPVSPSFFPPPSPRRGGWGRGRKQQLPKNALYRALDPKRNVLVPADPRQQHLPRLHKTRINGLTCYLPEDCLPLPQFAIWGISTVLSYSKGEFNVPRQWVLTTAQQAERQQRQQVGNIFHTVLAKHKAKGPRLLKNPNPANEQDGGEA